MTADCLPCCDSCFLTLVPPLGTEYPDEASAQAVLDDATLVSNCIGFHEPSVTCTAFSASFASNTLTFSATFSDPAGGTRFWTTLTLAATGTLTFTPVTWSGIVVNIYDYSGTLLETLDGLFVPGPVTSSSLSAANYICEITPATPPPGTPPSSGGATVASTATITPCTIRAAYDDGSGTSYLVCA